jgi:surfeit locus 1 family protein
MNPVSNMFRYRFRPQLIPTVICVLLFGLLISLGRWQWQRAEFKESLMQRYARGAQAQPLVVEEVIRLGQDAQGFPVAVNGMFDNTHSVLLDNQMEGAQPGFHVLTPLRTAGGPVVLVNRGWIPLPASAFGEKRQIPAILDTLKKPLALSGTVYFPSAKQMVLKADDFSHVQWPLLLQKLDLPAISQVLGVELPPFVIRLDAGSRAEQGDQLVRHWQLLVMTPEKHRAYSFQWFGMAVTLLILYIVFSCEKKTPP